MKYLPILAGSSTRWFSSSLSVCKFPRDPRQHKKFFNVSKRMKNESRKKQFIINKLWITQDQQGFVLDNILVRYQKWFYYNKFKYHNAAGKIPINTEKILKYSCVWKDTPVVMNGPLPGGLPYEMVRGACQRLWFRALKETTLDMGVALFDP